jgi:hypothetical protein
MTNELRRYIRLARNHVNGLTPAEGERQAAALDQFKLFLARKVKLGVRMEVFSRDGMEIEW